MTLESHIISVAPIDAVSDEIRSKFVSLDAAAFVGFVGDAFTSGSLDLLFGGRVIDRVDDVILIAHDSPRRYVVLCGTVAKCVDSISPRKAAEDAVWTWMGAKRYVLGETVEVTRDGVQVGVWATGDIASEVVIGLVEPSAA